ncbi:hypothetical protein LINPERPRIM_LOCUS37109 [Linum perenne]
MCNSVALVRGWFKQSTCSDPRKVQKIKEKRLDYSTQTCL